MDDDTEQLAAYHLWLLLQEPWIFVRWHHFFRKFEKALLIFSTDATKLRATV